MRRKPLMAINTATFKPLKGIVAIPNWCSACLSDKVPEDMSQTDPRFCQQCHDFLAEEYDKTPNQQKPENPDPEKPPEPPPDNTSPQKTCDKIPTNGNGRVGRPPKLINWSFVTRLSKQGMNVRDIAERISTEEKPVSYRTVARFLKNQQQLELPLGG